MAQLLKDNELEVSDATGTGPVDEERLRKDLVSHFVLRLAYCRTEDLRRWLLAQECTLFKHRLAKLTSKQLVTFMAQQGMTYAPTSAAEFAAVREAVHTVLLATHHSPEVARKMIEDGHSVFYSVPFESVPDLVRGRRVFLRAGRAYVHVGSLTSLLVGEFRAALSKALVITQRKWAARFAACGTI